MSGKCFLPGASTTESRQCGHLSMVLGNARAGHPNKRNKMKLNDKTARKLHGELINAMVRYEMGGFSIAQSCRTAAKRYKGYVAKQLNRIADLGDPEAEKMLDIYFNEWEEYRNANHKDMPEL